MRVAGQPPTAATGHPVCQLNTAGEEAGQQTFRFDTFGDEAFWGDTLQLQLAIAGDVFGGVGPGVSPNAALAVGLKVALEALPPELVAQLQRGEVDLDGRASRPDRLPGATLIPPAFGLAGVNLHTWTGWGSVTHWNALVANLEMHGKGTFFDPRLDDGGQFPIAVRDGLGHVRHDPDLITPRLAALHLYQLAIPAPEPPVGSFDQEAARRGELFFTGKAPCAACHVPPLYTEPGWNLHTPAEIGIDDFQANRAPDRRYRTRHRRHD
jgi:hypothetical protein